MTAVAQSLLDVMAPLVKEGKVRVTQSRRGVSIEINANVLFAPGRAELEPQSLEVLADARIEPSIMLSPSTTQIFCPSAKCSARFRASAIPPSPS